MSRARSIEHLSAELITLGPIVADGVLAAEQGKKILITVETLSSTRDQ